MRLRKKTPSGSSHQASALARLAQVFELDPGQLEAEFSRHRPVALNHALDTQCGSQEAWQAALLRTQKTAHARTAYPAEALKAVLQRYVAWQLSTSAVEQGFSKLERVCFPSPASAAKEQHLTRLRVANLDDARRESVVASARKLYLEVSPGHRASTDLN